nr:GAP family protein [Nocardioides sambongensis]
MTSDLSAALGDVLPAAFGVAISPIPIIATVLMLLSQRARRTAPAFAAGWILGILAVLLVVLAIAGPDGVDTTSGSDVAYWIKLVLGALFLVLAINTWRKRPRPGQPVEPRSGWRPWTRSHPSSRWAWVRPCPGSTRRT